MRPPKLPRAATRRPTAPRPRRHLPVVLGGAALAAVACGALAYVAAVVNRGWMDARSRFAHTPDYLYAAEEPFWFYGIAAVLLALAAAALTVGVRMVVHGWRGGTDDRG